MGYSGYLNIMVFFIPWIIYWSLSGLGYSYSIAISFIISIVCVLIQRRSIHFSDVFTVTYFGVASIATYVLGTDIFINYSGSIGYLALAVMAIVSIAIGSPYTFKVSKADWPESYWREKVFVYVNNVLTFMWTLIFICSSAIYFVFKHPYSTISSNILIGLGMMLSIVLPIKLPERIVKKKYIDPYKSLEWRVRPSREDEYDVIVVGAGVGGLTCGALLAKKGYRVLVLEQHHQIGGYCSSFKRKGFVFNTGVADVSGLWDRGPTKILLDRLGLDKDELFVKNSVRYIYKGMSIDVEALDQFPRKLVELFPEEKKNIERFFVDAEKAYMECYSDTHIYGAPLPPQLIAKVFGIKKLVDYPKDHPHFYNWMNKTFREVLDEYFRDEDLKTLISSLVSYLGVDPHNVSAASALTACISYYLYGGYFPRKGAQNFVENLRKVIERYGGRVLTNHRVDKIVIENREVRGVIARGSIYRSSIVVSNVNAKTTFLELVGRENLDKDFIEYIENLKMSPSCFMLFIGVDIDLSCYPILIKNLDEGYEIVINSNADPLLAPKGMSSITVMTSASYTDFPDRETEEYREKKMEKTRELLQKIEKIIPGISNHIVVIDAATPKTFERYTSTPEGAIYAFDQSIHTHRPYFKTPIKGLYLVGASTFPGGGIEAAIISGTICANDISGWKSKQF
ncbi:MAG: NAD(P)/FAD-dependent oxidoreductase [Ignisphaera sp.]